MTLNSFLLSLLVVSTLTGLFTEAIKNIFTEHKWHYSANTVAGVCSLVIAILLSVGYILYTGIAVTTQVVVIVIALIIMSWLCAMLGYDKVVQAFEQFKSTRKKDE